MTLYAIDFEVNNEGDTRLINYDKITKYEDLSIHHINSIMNAGYCAISSMCVIIDMDCNLNSVRQSRNHMYYNLLREELKSILRDQNIDKIL